MARKRTKSKPAKRHARKASSSREGRRRQRHSSRAWTVAALLALAVGGAVGGAALWAQVGPRSTPVEIDAAEQNTAAERLVGDVYYVNNRQCAMSDSPIAEEDLGRFESRVIYDGPIERFKGKTLVFNQCCSMCIESFPKKWAAERDQIMAEFGLTSADLVGRGSD